MNDCWNTIGVRGDGSCPELARYAHCRNCPVQAAVAADLLRRVPTSEYLAEWTAHFARPQQVAELDTESAVVFRIGTEWLALSTSVVHEVTIPKPVHTLPHRQSRAVLGLMNVRGELLVCVSLGLFIGLDSSPRPESSTQRAAGPRVLVLRAEDVRAVCPVDEVHGVVRFNSKALKPVPPTVGKASVSYTRKLLSWQNRSVGLMDGRVLFPALKRSFA